MGLNALQTQELQELQQVERERFKITDLGGVNWALRKLAALKAREAEVNQLADAEIERINAWREKELEGVKRDVEYFESLLMEYHAEQLKQDPKAKTITTPYGKLRSVTRKPSVKKVDEDALLAHLKAAGETQYIVVKESVAWGELKQVLQAGIVPASDKPTGYRVVDWNGEEVPGVEVDLGGTSFSVEVDV
jgi:phage host-nuclease inhibitor protein Gam